MTIAARISRFAIGGIVVVAIYGLLYGIGAVPALLHPESLYATGEAAGVFSFPLVGIAIVVLSTFTGWCFYALGERLIGPPRALTRDLNMPPRPFMIPEGQKREKPEPETLPVPTLDDDFEALEAEVAARESA